MEAELAADPRLTLIVVLAALPLVLALATAFTKSTVVLGALRVGLGAEAILPLPAVLAVALVVTAVVMAPVASETLTAIESLGGIAALAEGPASGWLVALEPLQSFLTVHAAPDELQFFADLQNRPPADPLVLVPAFLVTELYEALAMAVLIIVPLVLVDLLVAQALLLLGLVNQPTAILTVPLKLLLFLAVGGWDLVVGGLVEGYA